MERHISTCFNASVVAVFSISKMAWLSVLSYTIVVSGLWLCLSLFNNYTIARQIGFPIIISPVSAYNPLWILTQKVFPICSLFKHLPFGLGKWARVSYVGWMFQDEYAVHMELGDTVTVVNPSSIEIFTADSNVIYEALIRRKEYLKPALWGGLPSHNILRELTGL